MSQVQPFISNHNLTVLTVELLHVPSMHDDIIVMMMMSSCVQERTGKVAIISSC